MEPRASADRSGGAVPLRTVKKMSSIVSRIAVAVAVALIAFGLGLFPKEGMKGLAKGLAVTISLVVIAALLITAARSIGPKEK
jgi:hypothetical protein